MAVMPSRSEKSLKVSQWTLNFTQKVRERNLQVITKKLKDNGFKPVKSGLVIHFTGRAFVELSSEPLKYDNAAHKIGQAINFVGRKNWTLVARTDAVTEVAGCRDSPAARTDSEELDVSLTVVSNLKDVPAAKKDFKGEAAVIHEDQLRDEINALPNHAVNHLLDHEMEIDVLGKELRAKNTTMDMLGGQGDFKGAAARGLEKYLNAKKKMMEELAAKNDFKAAAAAQEEVNDLEALAQQLCAKKRMMDEFAAGGNCAGAAAAEERIMQKVTPKNDFKEAAVARESRVLLEEEGAPRGSVEHQSRVHLEEELNAKEEVVRELASKQDYEGAEAAQEKVKKIQILLERRKTDELAGTGEQQLQVQKKIPEEEPAVILENQLNAKNKMINELALKKDYKGAAALREDVMEIEALTKQLRAKITMMDGLAGQGNFKGAAAAQQEIKATEKEIMEKFGPKNHIAEAAAGEAVAHERKTHEEQLAAKKKTVDELAAKQDYMGAALAQAEVLKLEEQLSGLDARAKANGLLETQILSKTEQMNELAKKGDFAGAAAAQKELNALTKSRSAIPTALPPLPNNGSAIPRDLTTGRGPPLVSFEKLRVLSSSKVTQVPARNPRKGAGKKGAGRKGAGKKGASSESAWEDFAAIYLGCIKTKQIYQVVAYGDLVEKLKPYVDLRRQPIVNAENFERRPAKEELFCTSATVIKKCLEPNDFPTRFVYDVSDVTKHLATKDLGEKTTLGQFIDLVLRIHSVVEMPIQSGTNVGQFYLQVTGVDMDGVEVGPLRLWNHVEDDIQSGKTYIIRGLKVMNERQWNGDRYTRDREGAIKFECDARTAIEDVSEQPEITSYF